jgi:uncharacterized membrane-anchored protein
VRRPGLWLLGLLAAADVVVFGGLIAREEWLRARGAEARFPVEGYDPRDLLSGHYVRFRLVAEREAEALRVDGPGGPVAFCIEERDGRARVVRARGADDECRPFLAGIRRGGRVDFGVDRFYVDERRQGEAARLEPDRDTYLVGRVDAAGRLHAVDLVVRGRSLAGR